MSQANDGAMGGLKDCISEDRSAALLCPFLPDMTTIDSDKEASSCREKKILKGLYRRIRDNRFQAQNATTSLLSLLLIRPFNSMSTSASVSMTR